MTIRVKYFRTAQNSDDGIAEFALAFPATEGEEEIAIGLFNRLDDSPDEPPRSALTAPRRGGALVLA